MSNLLEILGRAITVDAADLIWHWLDTVKGAGDGDAAQAAQINDIIKLMDRRKTDTAQKKLQQYLFENPPCTRGRLAAAAICLAKAQLQEALEQLNSVYVRQPSNTMALYVLGHCHERLDRECEAVEFYQDCLKFKGYLQLPRQRLAAIYLKNGQLEKTIQQYEMLAEQYRDDMSTLVTLGYLYVAGGAYPQAIQTFNNAILIHPDNFHAENDRIDQLICDGRLYEALEELDQAAHQNPDRADLCLKRADVLCQLGAEADAVSQYQQASLICPDYLEAAIKLGTQYLRMQQLQLAARQFTKAVDINDRIVEAYIGLSTAQKAANKLDNALTTLSLAAAIQPNSSLLFAETATLQFRTCAVDAFDIHTVTESNELMAATIEAHRRQIMERPHNADLHYRLGVLLTSVSRRKEAIPAFQTALQINPTYNRARNKLAVSLFEEGLHDQALDHLAGPNCLDKATLELHYKTALLYCDKVKFASSLLNLERNLADSFTFPDAAVNISIVLQNLGLLDRATAIWDNLADTTDHAMRTYFPFSHDDH